MTKLIDKQPADPGRRQFMGTLGASAATASMTLGCSSLRKPVEKILPYSKRPEDLIPGNPVYFATGMNVGDAVYGVLVESQDGRPTKIEGNPSHPMSMGAANSWAQASIMDVYDADRAQEPSNQGKTTSWAAAEQMLASLPETFGSNDGKGIGILVDRTPSPTLWSQLAAFKTKYPTAQFYAHDPLHTGSSSSGATMVGGKGALRPQYVLSGADVILTIDADILGHEGDSVRLAREFVQGRKAETPSDPMNRLYSVESGFSVTGAKADHRLRLRSAQIGEWLLTLARQLGAKNTPSPTASFNGKAPMKWVQAVANDLLSKRGKCVVVVGQRQPAHVHALGHLINQQLGAIGKTVHYLEDSGAPDTQDLVALTEDILSSKVSKLLILGGNPAYTAPADLNFGSVLGQASFSVYLGYRSNETAQNVAWHIPSSHYLESWGDLRASDGTATIQQPLIRPIYRSMTATELMAHALGSETKTAHESVLSYWKTQRGQVSPAAERAAVDAEKKAEEVNEALEKAKAAVKQQQAKVGATAGKNGDTAGDKAVKSPELTAALQALTAAKALAGKAQSAADTARRAASTEAKRAGSKFERAWRKWLHDGVVTDSASKPVVPTFSWDGLAKGWIRYPTATSANELEINFEIDSSVCDGRFSNNAWLQELPDPITKLTWDNAALISTNTANKLGIKSTDQVIVKYEGRQLKMAAWIAKGIADDTIFVPLGYGRPKGGRTSTGSGFNGNALRVSTAPWFGNGATMTVTRGKYALAVSQDFDSLTPREGFKKRTFIRTATHDEWEKDPTYVENVEVMPAKKLSSLWEQPNETEGQQWGMAVDLNSCLGCGACVVACDLENNVSVVGKEEVLNGREMHWLRIDRYFDGDHDDIKAEIQPISCSQCETAPCENVCPVAATVHSPDGLNDMAYNRCIGTRYCANNCPFKVRRFNFYNYAQRNEESLGNLIQLQRNPDVTVRFRGVMEKCTYCVQRINESRIKAKRDGNGIIPDGDIVTACQQTCATNAITFGDINMKDSAVSKAKANSRNYGLLSELNLHSRTTFLAPLTNPNPALTKEGS